MTRQVVHGPSADRSFPQAVAGRLREFLHIESAGGIVLLAATAAALVWANSPWSGGYDSFWHTEVTLFSFGDHALTDTLAHWVNDGLMAIFFFVVGLEIKSELVAGELRDRRRASVPIIAAIGGMIVPALLFVVFNIGGDAVGGWGIPMATDIAFALGVLALLGSRVPSSLKVFLLTLAIVDDVGAILVIAVFYTDRLSFPWLIAGGVLLGAIALLRRAGMWYTPVYVLLGAGVWLAALESGVHATIAGVVLGVMAPAIALRPEPSGQVDADLSVDEIRRVLFDVRETAPVTDRLLHLLHPISSFLILPIFALANAGIAISREGLSDAAGSSVTIGIVVGLVVGKVVGVTGAAWLATSLGVGDLPDDLNWRHVTGIGALAGIGFTVAIFITGLAFDDPGIVQQAKLGVIVASVLAAAVGVLVLRGGGGASQAPAGAADLPVVGAGVRRG